MGGFVMFTIIGAYAKISVKIMILNAVLFFVNYFVTSAFSSLNVYLQFLNPCVLVFLKDIQFFQTLFNFIRFLALALIIRYTLKYLI